MLCGGHGRKRLYSNDYCMATAWMQMIYQSIELPTKVHCRNHDWLDWTDNNIYVIWNPQSQETFENQLSFQKKFVTDYHYESLVQPTTCESDDPDIRDIFREVARVPAISTRACTPEY